MIFLSVYAISMLVVYFFHAWGLKLNMIKFNPVYHRHHPHHTSPYRAKFGAAQRGSRINVVMGLEMVSFYKALLLLFRSSVC